MLLSPPDKKDYYRSQFGGKANVIVEGLNPAFKGIFARIVTSAMRSAINTHTNLWSKMRSLERGDSGFLTTYFKRFLTATLGRSTWYKNLLRRMLLWVAPTEDVLRVFEFYKPELLFATYVANYNFDVPLMCEARRRDVKTLGMTRSWDTLTSHGLMRVMPDALIVQNEFLKEMALRYQAVNPAKTPIHVIGLPHYDVLFNREAWLESREEFFSHVGLDPSKKLILYGAMGDFLFPHEGEIADVFERLIEEGKIKEPVEVLFRAHPKFTSPFERIKNTKHVKLDRKATYIDGTIQSMEMEDKDTKHLMNSIYWADVVVTGGSTFAIDAAVMDKPIVCIGFDGTTSQEKVPFWHSVKRFYDTYTHFEVLMATGGARLANTPEELAEEINRYLKNPSLERKERKKIIELFVSPFDNKASERLSEILLEETRRLTDSRNL